MFVNLNLDAPPLTDQLGPLFAESADLPIESLTYSHRVVHELAVNWKTYTDNYSEGYHIPLVHPELNREVFAKQYQVKVHDHYCVHSAPARDGAIYAGKWLWRYPNLALNLYPDGMTVERFVPTGPRSTQIVYDYFFADVSPSRGERQRGQGPDQRRCRRRGPADLRAGPTQPGVRRLRHRAA